MINFLKRASVSHSFNWWWSSPE